MKTKLLILLFLALSLPPIDRYRVKAQAVTNQYLFIEDKQNGDLSLISVNVPAIEKVARRTLSKPEPKVGSFQAAFYNDKSGWLAIIYRIGAENWLNLVNISSGELRRVIEADNVRVGATSWSPDGMYLALSLYDDKGESLNLYSVTDNELTRIADAAGQVTWNSDSSQFAVEQYFCKERACQLLIQVFDANSLQVETVLDVWNSIPERYRAGPATCLLDWSPDGRYITFMFSCDHTMPDVPSELYVWDVETNKLHRLTNAATKMRDALELGILKGDYGVLWRDSETLLIGIYVSSVKTVVSQTVEVHFPEMTQTIIANSSVQKWLPNPITGELAIRSFTAVEPQVVPQSSSLHILHYTKSETLDLTAPSLGEGCDMAWSADGKYLAFTQRGDLYCGLPVKAIRFYDDATQQISEYVLPNYDPMVTTILPLGWVQIGKLD